MSATYDIPHPGDQVDGCTVVASCWGNDSPEDGTVWWLLFLLNPEAPYFSVVQQVRSGDVILIGRHHNIVPAVEEYQENGGDY